MKSILAITVFMLLSVSAFAETKIKGENKITETESVSVIENVNAVQLTGSIMDDRNKETLVGATVYVDGKKCYSDLDGNFSVSDITPGKHQIKVEFISYTSAVVEIDTENKEKIDIYLHQN